MRQGKAEAQVIDSESSVPDRRLPNARIWPDSSSSVDLRNGRQPGDSAAIQLNLGNLAKILK